mmetsp:Transcript_19892/g.57031  ORF Transcript_19892/g.57031 Transcript_19892/m.57031 type:complete len:216 (-) Transcript_19892:424-1071(-)
MDLEPGALGPPQPADDCEAPQRPCESLETQVGLCFGAGRLRCQLFLVRPLARDVLHVLQRSSRDSHRDEGLGLQGQGSALLFDGLLLLREPRGPVVALGLPDVGWALQRRRGRLRSPGDFRHGVQELVRPARFRADDERPRALPGGDLHDELEAELRRRPLPRHAGGPVREVVLAATGCLCRLPHLGDGVCEHHILARKEAHRPKAARHALQVLR